MNKVMLTSILIMFFVMPGYAGENQDKRKAKREARTQELREHAQRADQERQRDLRAEDELYKEIQAQERLLSQLRRKLTAMHAVNTQKYGFKASSFQERDEHIHHYGR
jgi:uncharacterized membrane protein YccC